MDDHDLGALLDATAPAAVPSDETLARIRGRAAQRRRRTALAGGALAVALATGLALGLSALGAASNDGSVTPADRTSSSAQIGTTTIVPDGRCFIGDVTFSIGQYLEQPVGTGRWAVMARSRADTRCRLIDPITATIRTTDSRILTAVSGTTTARVRSTDFTYVRDLEPDAPTIVARLIWKNPCSTGPVDLEVGGPAPAARLRLPRQRCALGPVSTSSFRIEGAGPVAGTDCRFGTLSLAIRPDPTSSERHLRWLVEATAHTTYLCRVHGGIDASIEASSGVLLDGTPGNPAGQGVDVFHDLFQPERQYFVARVSWDNPCSSDAVYLVVRFREPRLATEARQWLPAQPCDKGLVPDSHFAITGPDFKP